jgi:hypothetical protein
VKSVISATRNRMPRTGTSRLLDKREQTPRMQTLRDGASATPAKAIAPVEIMPKAASVIAPTLKRRSNSRIPMSDAIRGGGEDAAEEQIDDEPRSDAGDEDRRHGENPHGERRQQTPRHRGPGRDGQADTSAGRTIAATAA